MGNTNAEIFRDINQRQLFLRQRSDSNCIQIAALTDNNRRADYSQMDVSRVTRDD